MIKLEELEKHAKEAGYLTRDEAEEMVSEAVAAAVPAPAVGAETEADGGTTKFVWEEDGFMGGGKEE